MTQYIYKIILELWEFGVFLRCPMFAFILSEQESPRMTQKTALLDKMARTICLCEHVRSAERITRFRIE